MWPSFLTASWLYNLANYALVGSLIVGVVATVFVVWMGNVKEDYLWRDVSAAKERAATLEKQAADARLQTEQLKSAIRNRSIDAASYVLLVQALSVAPSSAIVRYPQGDHEAWQLSAQILSAFLAAKWKVRMEARPFTAAGIWVSQNAATPSQAKTIAPTVNAVKSAFHSAGIVFSEQNGPSTEQIGDTIGPRSPPVKIIIGSKPIAELP